uniref:Oxidoreductase FAD/NAD(P)-binding domain-containing protein n=1 Tax=Kalmanozyma brasiliensis (strain GHG001) TaxID=1365824 RepID=V5ENB7_KALBG
MKEAEMNAEVEVGSRAYPAGACTRYGVIVVAERSFIPESAAKASNRSGGSAYSLPAEKEVLTHALYRRYRVHYFANEASESWKGGIGFVTKVAIEKHMPQPADDIQILYCGPPAMREAVLKHLDVLGYEKARSASKLEHQVFC